MTSQLYSNYFSKAALFYSPHGQISSHLLFDKQNSFVWSCHTVYTDSYDMTIFKNTRKEVAEMLEVLACFDNR